MATATVAAPAARTAQATPIWWPLKAWFFAEVLFGLGSIGSIFFQPDKTETGWAWKIDSVVTAAILGSFYLASAVVFLFPLFARQWQHVRAVVLPAAVFSSFMLAATFLHWDKFFVGTLPFNLWFASYILPPPIFGFLYWWHQQRSAPPGTGVTVPLPGWVRSFLLANGILITLIAVVGFFFPVILRTIDPWPFTDLTARAFCGWLTAVGLGQITMWRENDWPRIKITTGMFLLLPLTLLVQMFRYYEQVSWLNPFVWFLILDTAILALALGYLWAVDGGGPVRRPAVAG